MMGIIYFYGDSLCTGMSKKQNNLKISCLSEGVVKVIGYCIQQGTAI
jgi:hypothetical protein